MDSPLPSQSPSPSPATTPAAALLTKEARGDFVKYAVIAIVLVVIVYLLYVLWRKHQCGDGDEDDTSNSGGRSARRNGRSDSKKSSQSSPDDTIRSDYDLHGEVRALKDQQQSIMNGLSQRIDEDSQSHTIILKLYLKDSPSRTNIDLIDFLQTHIRNIVVRGGITLSISIVDATQIKQLRKQNINRLPALQIDRQSIIGTRQIIDYLTDVTQKSQRAQKPKDESEILESFFAEELRNTKRDANGKFVSESSDDHGDAMSEQKIKDQMQKETQRRGLRMSGGATGADRNFQDSDPEHENMTGGGGGGRASNIRSDDDIQNAMNNIRSDDVQSNQDDILIQRMFETTEE